MHSPSIGLVFSFVLFLGGLVVVFLGACAKVIWFDLFTSIGVIDDARGTGRYCVCKNFLHLVFVPKYRKRVFSREMLAGLQGAWVSAVRVWGGSFWSLGVVMIMCIGWCVYRLQWFFVICGTLRFWEF